MADNTIATYYVQLEPTTKGITQSIENEFAGLGKTGGSILSTALGMSLSGAAGAIAGAATQAISGGISAITDFGKASIESGAQFDTSMSQVAATMGKTVDEIGDLRDFAQEMGQTTTFSATQAADALNYMALAGYDANTSMEMLPNVLNLAAAGSFDLARASDMVTDTQTAFGISLERTSQMVDEMAKAASTGNTSVEQLGDAFLVVGGLAQELNGGLVQMGPGTLRTVDGVQELEIALTAMANAGIKGSEAGTHMRNMLLKLSDPTNDGAMALEAMGVSVFNAQGNMRSLADIFGDLSNKMDDMTQEQKISTISDLFNTRDIASAEALLNAVGQDWDEIGKSILQAEGSAQQMADTQLDNLNGDITLFKSALEGAQIVISDQLTPTLREFVQFGTEGIQNITDGFKEGGLTGAMSALGETLSKGISMGIEKAPEIIQAALTLITSVVTALKDNAPMIISAVFEIVGMILEQLPVILDLGIQIILALAQGIAEGIPNLIPTIIEVILSLVDVILDNIDLILDAAVQIINALVEGLLGNLDKISLAVNTITWKLIATFISLLPEIVSLAFQIIYVLITSLVTSLMNMLSGDYWNDALSAIVHSFTDIDWADIGIKALEGIAEGFSRGWEKLKETATNLVRSLKAIFTEGFDIHSPSKVFEDYGEMIDQGLAIGISSGASAKASQNLANEVTSSFNPAVAGAGGGDIIIPVYLGNELLQTIVVDALNVANYRSGGR